MTTGDLRMFVIDVMRHDREHVENLKSIVTILNDDGCFGWLDYWDHEFSTSEVVPVLRDLVNEGLIRAYATDENIFRVPTDWSETGLENWWFQLTPKANEMWASWEPPPTTTG